MFTEEIARGMQWLDSQDAHEPWIDPWFSPSRVSTETLNVLHPSECMIGQTNPADHSYDTLMDLYGVQWMDRHGFTIGIDADPSGGRMAAWDVLTEEWKQAIHIRRQAGLDLFSA